MPIEITFIIGETLLTPILTKRLWKRLDSKIFLSILDREIFYLPFLSLNLRETIDLYIDLLIKVIGKTIDKVVPLKRGSQYDKGFWTQEYRNEILYTR